MQGLTFLALAILSLMYYSKRKDVLDLKSKLKRISDIDQYYIDEKNKIDNYYNEMKHKIDTERNALERQRKKYQDYYNKQEELLDSKRNEKITFLDIKRKMMEDLLEKKEQSLLEREKNIEILSKKRKEELTAEYEKRKQYLQEERDMIDTIISSKISAFPVIASMIADYTAKRDEYIAKTIEEIRPRAFKARDEVNKLKEEKRKLLAENLEYKWELKNLRSLLPWIDDIKDDFIVPQTDEHFNLYYNGKDDDAKYWLTQEEYGKLSTIEKYQLALDRYMKRHKSNAEIGKEYERYIGYLYENNGFKVTYWGIEKGLEDLGRDLICTKSNQIHIVQCKCWSEKKEIHEKHINQLFGTTVMYYMTNINPSGSIADFYDYLFSKRLIPVFVATTNYSQQAISFANNLGVILKTVKLGTYPVIKCNIGNKGEKIYHLPFDQQYDKVKINKAGECLVTTVAEAEANGFRRAMRWFG